MRGRALLALVALSTGCGHVPGDDACRDRAPPRHPAVGGPRHAVTRPGFAVDAARPRDIVRVHAVRVVDGDTLVARTRGRLVSIRLIGVDAPELERAGRTAVASTAGRCGRPGWEAYRALARLVRPGAVLHVAADRERRDRYGRSLRYVWTRRGVFVNAALIRGGRARAMVIPPNDRFADVLRAAEAAARRASEGRRSTCA